MRKILWQSQHEPLAIQLQELQRLFGAVEVEQNPRPFSSAEEIEKRYKQGMYNDLVVVAPLSVIARLCELQLRPLWAEMEQLPPERREEAHLSYRGRHYRFAGFRRVQAVKVEFTEVF